MEIVFEQVRTGGDRNFGYILGDREAGEAILIDPSYAPEVLIARAKQQGMEVRTVVNTHGHHDHTEGNLAVKRATGAQLAAHPQGAGKPDLPLHDLGHLEVGSLKLQILHVPGHCVDHIVLFEPTFRLLLTGDHLFVGKVGGTSSPQDAELQFNSLHRLFEEFPPDTTIWPGHDFGCRPSSTLQLEAATNPFLRVKELSAFVELKKTWSSYKAAKGLV